VAYDPLDFVEPKVCVDENITTDAGGALLLQPWSVIRPVVSVVAKSMNDGKLKPQITAPGKLMIDQKFGWRNDGPLDQLVVIRVTRGPKEWVVSNPNVIQFRDRWTSVIDKKSLTPEVPVTTGYFNSQCGSGFDVGTNSVSEPDVGVQFGWADVSTDEEIVGPVKPGQTINAWFRCYVWTPWPFSDNANKNSPRHEAYARWAKLEILTLPQQGNLVTG